MKPKTKQPEQIFFKLNILSTFLVVLYMLFFFGGFVLAIVNFGFDNIFPWNFYYTIFKHAPYFPFVLGVIGILYFYNTNILRPRNNFTLFFFAITSTASLALHPSLNYAVFLVGWLMTHVLEEYAAYLNKQKGTIPKAWEEQVNSK